MVFYTYQPSSSGMTDTVLGVGDATDREGYLEAYETID